MSSPTEVLRPRIHSMDTTLPRLRKPAAQLSQATDTTTFFVLVRTHLGNALN